MSTEIETVVDTILANAGIVFLAEYRGVRKNALNGNHAMDEWLCEFTTTSYPSKGEEFEFYTGIGLRRSVGGTSFPVKPTAASVLHALILDRRACEQSFASWCSDFGYDTDSRKAFSIYEACQQNTDKINRVINRDVLSQLEEALQEY